jgi:hypothetical protein
VTARTGPITHVLESHLNALTSGKICLSALTLGGLSRSLETV